MKGRMQVIPELRLYVFRGRIVNHFSIFFLFLSKYNFIRFQTCSPSLPSMPPWLQVCWKTAGRQAQRMPTLLEVYKEDHQLRRNQYMEGLVLPLRFTVYDLKQNDVTRKTLTNWTSRCCIAAQWNIHYFNWSWSLFHNYNAQFAAALCFIYFLVVLNSGNFFSEIHNKCFYRISFK